MTTEEKFPPETWMVSFQEANCRGCRFADAELVGTGKPCCTYAFRLDIQEGKCYTRREADENG